jgi:hypothetical protein
MAENPDDAELGDRAFTGITGSARRLIAVPIDNARRLMPRGMTTLAASLGRDLHAGKKVGLRLALTEVARPSPPIADTDAVDVRAFIDDFVSGHPDADLNATGGSTCVISRRCWWRCRRGDLRWRRVLPN